MELKTKINELNIQIAKMSNENISLLKEKISIENKLKLEESKNQEINTNIFLANQKVKNFETQLNHSKEENNKLNTKIENFLNQIDDLKNEIFNQKNTVQSKNFDIEKSNFENKLLNQKISDLTNTIDKILKEKSSLSELNQINIENYKEKITTLTEENKTLKSTNEKLNSKIKELANVNLNSLSKKSQQMLQSKEKNNNFDDSEMAIDFFKNNNNIEISPSNLIKENELKTENEKLNIEIQRINELNKKNEEMYLNQINQLETENENIKNNL
jgi:chromosome segregation ATPase